MKFHCLFEQSGTFKNEFKKLGYEAYDYDILNEFGETDYVIDLFNEIEQAFEGGASIFDNITSNDQIIAFFPCTRFEDQILLSFRGDNNGQRNWSDEKKIDYSMKLHNELNRNYQLVCKLFLLCIKKKLKLIMENPYAEQHYLKRYWCIKPKLIDKDRRERGDYFRKPTQYWFVNCEPQNNFIFGEYYDFKIKETAPIRYTNRVKKEMGTDLSITTIRSMIHPDYANRFIREFIL